MEQGQGTLELFLFISAEHSRSRICASEHPMLAQDTGIRAPNADSGHRLLPQLAHFSKLPITPLLTCRLPCHVSPFHLLLCTHLLLGRMKSLVHQSVAAIIKIQDIRGFHQGTVHHHSSARTELLLLGLQRPSTYVQSTGRSGVHYHLL